MIVTPRDRVFLLTEDGDTDITGVENPSTLHINLGDGELNVEVLIKAPGAHEDCYKSLATYVSTALAPLGSASIRLRARYDIRVTVTGFATDPSNFASAHVQLSPDPETVEPVARWDR